MLLVEKRCDALDALVLISAASLHKHCQDLLLCHLFHGKLMMASPCLATAAFCSRVRPGLPFPAGAC